jgi:hypothetical protein
LEAFDLYEHRDERVRTDTSDHCIYENRVATDAKEPTVCRNAHRAAEAADTVERLANMGNPAGGFTFD